MLNEDFILRLITPHLNNHRAIGEAQYFKLFSSLSRQEHYEVIDLLIKHDIEIEYDDMKDEDSIPPMQVMPPAKEDRGDYRNLLNLSNEILAKMGQDRNHSAVAALVVKNEKMIYKIVQSEVKKYAKTCMTEDDLFQEGCLGLYKAVEKFDAALGFSFLTYCTHWVRQSISRSVIDNGFLVRIPVHMFEITRRVQYYRSLNPLLSQRELVDHIIKEEEAAARTITEEQIITCLVLAEQYLNMTSINVMIGENEDSELSDYLPDTESATTEEIADHNELREILDRLLETLSPKEEQVIRARFGFDTGIPLTLEEIGTQLGVTRERIRQIEAKALRKLKHPSHQKHLCGYKEEL